MRIFALNDSRALGEAIAATLALPLSKHEERDFEGGEHKTRSLENVRGKDVYVIHSLYSEAGASVNDKLCRLLFFIGALKDASAKRVTVIVPYLCYARKDRRTKSRDPVTTRYIAQLFEAVGTDHMVTLDVHNLQAFQNGFRCPTDHLEAKNLFVEHFAPLLKNQSIVVVSPDIGGAKRAEKFRQRLSEHLEQEVSSAFLEKYRSAGKVTGEAIVGDVNGKSAIIIDDLISSGGTLARAANTCQQSGARHIYVAATHGAFVSEADPILANSALEQLVITNTIPPFQLTSEAIHKKLLVLDIAPLFAEAILRMHTGGSITELINPT